MTEAAHEAATETAVSRVCVKNLPPDADASRLREHFSARGEVTDAKILRTSDGRSRQIAFVGFKTAQQAQEAVSYFSRTFMDTWRLTVELAKPIGQAADGVRPWSKYSVGSSRHASSQAAATEQPPLTAREAKKAARSAKAAAISAGGVKESDDPRLAEFLALMQPRSKQRIWADAAEAADGGAGAAAEQHPPQAGASGEAPVAGRHHDNIDDDDVMEDDADEGELPVVQAQQRAALNAMSDLDYMRSRMRARLSDSDGEDGSDDDADVEAEQPPLPEPVDTDDVGNGHTGIAAVRTSGDVDGQPSGDDGAEATGRLFFRNLAFTATEEELEELCAPFGHVSSVHILTDRATKASKGLAYVQFAHGPCAAAALRALDKQSFQGRLLHVLPAQHPPSVAAIVTDTEGAAGAGSYKAQKEAQRKATAGQTAQQSTWYIRPDTVAAAMAARYGVSKTDVMEPGSSGVATRLALGEAQIMNDTRTQLTALGCDVATMDAAADDPVGTRRSRVALLIKNLPFSADADELSELCRRHGKDGLDRLLLPDTKALAVAVFVDAASARAAFAGLAYKRYQHVPLYLEWAPAGLVADAALTKTTAAAGAAPVVKASAAKATKAGKAAPLSAAEAASVGVTAVAPDGEAEDAVLSGQAAQRTVYVKNLAWATDDAALKAHFTASLPAASVRSVSVAQRPGKRAGTMVSAGYGFVELDSESAVLNALRTLDGTALDGHAIKLQRSRAAVAAATATADDPDADGAAPRSGGAAASTKLVVRNVAFEATKTDIRGLFAPFGQVKSVRLPRKFDGTHRGFAFVEMTTKTEAKAAFAAVGRTHLYGRRLVTEWAADEDADDAAQARNKAARDMATMDAAEGPRHKKRAL